jgi:group II intron reverse transcriptase/maturase
MRQLELFVDQRSLFDKLCDPAYLKEGFKAVKRNGGSAGTDGVTVKVFACGLSDKLGELSRSLKDWTYQPSPVRRVEIPKPGKGSGVRLLGVPCIKDRVVQATLKILLEPLIDPSFSDNSYGFRPGRSQRHAVEAAQQIVNTGKEYVVDIDMSKFFDRVNHDRLIHGLSQFVSDKRILRIVGMTLRSGVIKDGVFYTSPEGTVQGSPHLFGLAKSSPTSDAINR